MEIKTDDQMLKEAATGLKNNIKTISKEIKEQNSIIEVIGIKSFENAQKVSSSQSKFDKALDGLKSDRRNLIILFLLITVTLLFIIVY